MRERFEQQMEILHTELIELGALCEQAIGRTYEVLLEGNQRAAEEIIKKDQVVDAKEREIEDLCFRIILQQQPVARDLRQVSAALKMITDMERIGDQAADIADIVKVMSLGVPDASIRLKDMAKATASMVTKCIDAYVKQDLKLAREVIDFDDIVDDLFDEVKDEILQGMRKGTDRIHTGIERFYRKRPGKRKRAECSYCRTASGSDSPGYHASGRGWS